MKWQHTLVWSCQAPRHNHLKFDTSAECELHMRQEHVREISDAQIPLLVEKSAQPAADPLEVLLRMDKDRPQERSVCRFCPFAVENSRVPDPRALVPDASTSNDSMKQMRDHIVAHLESIALLSLPEQEDLDNAASDELQSESAKRSSRGANQDLESLPSTSDGWNAFCESIQEGLFQSQEASIFDFQVEISADRDAEWSFMTAKYQDHESPFDPGRDRVLTPFVERARRIQMLEALKRHGIPIIIITEPDGLEVPEAQWSSQPK